MKTPYFLIDEKELEKNLLKLKEALSQNWDNFVIGYSFKTNALPYLLNYMKQKGCYAEVVSEDEYMLAGKVNYDKKKIIYNGPVKGKETFLKAVSEGAVVNIDSNREIRWLEELEKGRSYSIGIRINFDLEHYCPGETSSGSEESRFGFCYENGELEKVIKRIKEMENIQIRGIHLHNSTKTRSIKVYKEISRMACKIAAEFSLALEYVDIGGGFFGGLENKPQFNEYISVAASELQSYFSSQDTTLIVEPGTSLISSPVDFVTSVVDIKKNKSGVFVITDGSRIHVDPLMRKKSYFSEICRNGETQRKVIDKQVISGFTCMENDRMFILENEREIKPGDSIIYKKVGAYTMCLNPLFIQFFPAVYWKNEKGMECVRKRWTTENYMQNSIWEDNKVEHLSFKLWD